MGINKAVLIGMSCLALAGCAQQQKKVDQAALATLPTAPVVTEIAVPPPQATVAKSSEPSGSAVVHVEEAIFCTAVKDRIPQGVAESFSRSVKKVFFFNRVTTANHPTSITHVWYWNERKMAEVPLDVRSGNWRTWSSKRIDSSWRGSWAVKVLDANGEVVTTKNFEIQ